MGAPDLIRHLERFARFPSTVHGPGHWARVCRFGACLAEREGLSPAAARAVEVFAWTHDLAREDDGAGREHAVAGATHLDEVAAELFPDLSPLQLSIVRVAIELHSDGMTAREAHERGLLDPVFEIDPGGSPDEQTIATIGCAWDADRLDLQRFGIRPEPALMSTRSCREVLPLSSRIHDEVLHMRGDESVPTCSFRYDPTLRARRGK